jgi:hypothetical protein
VRSPKQLGGVLYDRWKLPVATRGKPKVLAHDVRELVIAGYEAEVDYHGTDPAELQRLSAL